MVEAAAVNAAPVDASGEPDDDSPQARFQRGWHRGVTGERRVAGKSSAANTATADDSTRASAAVAGVGPAGPAVPGALDPALRERFEAGRRRGLDPANQTMTGVARTTLNADWLGGDCAVCGHTFRFDDLVYVEFTETGRVERLRHHTPNLPCSGQVTAEPPPSRDLTDRFFSGIDRANPPELATTLLHADHPLVAPRRQRQKCRFCGDTFRPLESAIVCPCRPEQPMCQSGLHRDPRRGLLCYDEWTKSVKLAKCLMDPRRPLPDRPRPAAEEDRPGTRAAVTEAITQVVTQAVERAAERAARGQAPPTGEVRLNLVINRDAGRPPADPDAAGGR
jgi:hypothetical protein